MIDIQKLKQFPLVFRLLEEYAETRWTTRLAIFTDKLTNEELVLFLDEQNVVCLVSLCYKWSYRIIRPSDQVGWIELLYTCDNAFESRSSATEAAILKAFELLEYKLKQN